MTQVLIVEDQRIPREYMEHLITSDGRYALAASIGSAELAIIKCRRQHVDLVLMDVCTAGAKDGIEAAEEIKAEFPNIKIIIVTSMVEVSYLDRARKAGVESFWYKDISSEELIDVIDRTMSGERFFPDKTPPVKLGNAQSTDLTAKEINVLRLVCEGFEYGEIGDALGMSINTVKTHISHILNKTGYANKTKLAIAVTSQKFIIPTMNE